MRRSSGVALYTSFSSTKWTVNTLLQQKELVDEGLVATPVTVKTAKNGFITKTAMNCRFCRFVMRDGRPFHFKQHSATFGHQIKAAAAAADGGPVQDMLTGGAPPSTRRGVSRRSVRAC